MDAFTKKLRAQGYGIYDDEHVFFRGHGYIITEIDENNPPLENVDNFYVKYLRCQHREDTSERLMDLECEELIFPLLEQAWFSFLLQIPSWVKKSEFLRVFMLFSPGWHGFSECIRSMKYLEVLAICAGEMNEIPVWISELRFLKEVEVSLSFLRFVPEEMGHLRFLKRIDLSDNMISEIPDSLTKMQRLKSIDISYNRFAQIPVFPSSITVKSENNEPERPAKRQKR